MLPFNRASVDGFNIYRTVNTKHKFVYSSQLNVGQMMLKE